jgi:DNA-directed RNA polymerase subunit RPC12/RpoP
MGDEWAEEREKAVLNTVYYCETCNLIIEHGDADISTHKRELPHHRMRRVMILRCSRCGSVVTDSSAEYSPEKNQFWCKNCISEAGAKAFHSS